MPCRNYRSMSEVVSWIDVVSLVASSLAVAFTWINWRDRRQSEAVLHVARVSVQLREGRPGVYAANSTSVWGDVVIRNDGPAAVTIGSVAMGYGNRFTLDRATPEMWEFDPIPDSDLETRLLSPGMEIAVGAPAPWSDTPMLGPLVGLTDINGWVWQRSTWGWRRLSTVDWRLRRRDLWFEARSWWPRLDAWMARRAMKAARRHPTRRPVEIFLIDFLWGYRGGRSDVERFPLNAPATWRYDSLIDWPQQAPPEVRSPVSTVQHDASEL